MISTVSTQQAQLTTGSYKFGSGPEQVLFIGSCRCIPYLNYLDYLNPHKFTIHFLDPFYFHWDTKGNRVDLNAKLAALETDSFMLNLIRSAKWFIHEYYAYFGIFNSAKDNTKNIFQFGMNPEHEISIPNFHDIMVFFQDYVDLDKEIKEMARVDLSAGRTLTPELQAIIRERGLANIQKFLTNCRKTDFADFADVFEKTWRAVRYAWTGNHVTNNFTMAIFRSMNDRFLKLAIPESFWSRVKTEDIYGNHFTPFTQYDIDNYGLTWGPAQQQLKIR